MEIQRSERKEIEQSTLQSKGAQTQANTKKLSCCDLRSVIALGTGICSVEVGTRVDCGVWKGCCLSDLVTAWWEVSPFASRTGFSNSPMT